MRKWFKKNMKNFKNNSKRREETLHEFVKSFTKNDDELNYKKNLISATTLMEGKRKSTMSLALRKKKFSKFF